MYRFVERRMSSKQFRVIWSLYGMKVSEDEILFIYNSVDSQQYEGLIYVKALRQYKITELDVTRDTLTPLQLGDIAKSLNVAVKEMLIPDSELSIGDVMDLDDNNFLDYLASNLIMLRTPIVVYSLSLIHI